jgi:periplasmic divalent cation tolerance protein
LSAILILSTAPTREEATRIAEVLVAEKLAACVQLSPIESWYRWEGKVEQAAEIRLHVKTTEALADRVEQRIAALHSYAVPELIRIAVSGGSAAYLDWVRTSTAQN